MCNLLSDSIQLQLTSQHLVLLLLQSSLSLLQGRLQLQLLGFQTLPDFVNLVDRAASLADLVHDILDLIGKSLVLPADFFQLENSLFISRLHLEQLGGSVTGFLLANIKIEGKTIDL